MEEDESTDNESIIIISAEDLSIVTKSESKSESVTISIFHPSLRDDSLVH